MAVKKTATESFSQPEINIGLIGHVDHGKTTLLKALTGHWADTHSEEMKRGITIKLGYADMQLYKTKEGTSTNQKIEGATPQRIVSFIDAPGHETLMATMLSGAAIMDGALLLVAANEECPQPQTREHLMALEIIGIKNIIIVQNKIDSVTLQEAQENYEQIKKFVKGTVAEKAPIIPVAAKYGVNIDYLIQAIQEVMPTPQRDLTKDPILFVARSFDINKPGSAIEKLMGGVLGGSVIQGQFKKGQEIEIIPGRKVEERGTTKWIPLKTTIQNMQTAATSVETLRPGGSVALLTELDPSLVKSDKLSGSVVGLSGKMPQIYNELHIEPILLQRMVGAKEELVIEPIKKGEQLMLTVYAAATVGVVAELQKKQVHLKLKRPISAFPKAKIAISRRVGNRWRLIGYTFVA